MSKRIRYCDVSSSGFTLVEFICVLMIMGVLAGIAVSNLKEYENPLTNGSDALVSFFKTTRETAIASTSAYTVTASSNRTVTVAYAPTCADASPVTDPELSLELPTGVTFTTTTWVVCFSSRGLADANPEIVLRDSKGQEKTVKVYLGGGVRIT